MKFESEMDRRGRECLMTKVVQKFGDLLMRAWRMHLTLAPVDVARATLLTYND